MRGEERIEEEGPREFVWIQDNLSAIYFKVMNLVEFHQVLQPLEAHFETPGIPTTATMPCVVLVVFEVVNYIVVYQLMSHCKRKKQKKKKLSIKRKRRRKKKLKEMKESYLVLLGCSSQQQRGGVRERWIAPNDIVILCSCDKGEEKEEK